MRFLCGLNGVTLRDRQQREDARNLFEVNKMKSDIEEYLEKLRGHFHLMPDYSLPRRVFIYIP
jgi:hypothetical protein